VIVNEIGTENLSAREKCDLKRRVASFLCEVVDTIPAWNTRPLTELVTYPGNRPEVNGPQAFLFVATNRAPGLSSEVTIPGMVEAVQEEQGIGNVTWIVTAYLVFEGMPISLWTMSGSAGPRVWREKVTATGTEPVCDEEFEQLVAQDAEDLGRVHAIMYSAVLDKAGGRRDELLQKMRSVRECDTWARIVHEAAMRHVEVQEGAPVPQANADAPRAGTEEPVTATGPGGVGRPHVIRIKNRTGRKFGR
jgi:hypothetical protein